jgi:hypothetical protein
VGKVVGFDRARPFSNEAAAKRIRTLWREGSVTWLPHAEERLFERGLNILDVEHLVRYGRVVENSRPGGVWRYKIKGRTVEGKTASAVFEPNGDLLTVVTVMLSRK